MPRFFFDLSNHESLPDPTGTELPDANAARVEAILFSGAWLRDHPEMVWDGQEMRVIVRDENHRTIFTLITLSVDCTG